MGCMLFRQLILQNPLELQFNTALFVSQCQIFHGFSLVAANLCNRTFNALYVWALHYGNEVCKILYVEKASMSQNRSGVFFYVFAFALDNYCWACAVYVLIVKYRIAIRVSSLSHFFFDVRNKISPSIRQVYSFMSLKLIPEHNRRSCYQ